MGRSLLSREVLLGEKARFLAVGAINTLVGYLVYLALLATLGRWVQSFSDSTSSFASALGEHYYLVAQWATWAVTVPISATTMRKLVFRSTSGAWLHQVGRAYLVYLPAQGISFLLLWLLVSVLGLVPALAVLVVVVITTVLTYIAHKYFTFRVPLEVGEVPPEDLLD